MAFFSKNKTNSSEHSIESVPFFPAIAWGIFILFAAFVYLLAEELKETTLVLEAATYENTSAVENGVSVVEVE